MKPSYTLWYISIGLLIVLFGVTIYFGVVAYIRESNIQATQQAILETQTKIDTIASDRKILIANIIKNNSLRPSLDLGPLLLEFRTAAAKANVRLKGFSIADDTISTTLIATEWDSGVHPDPVATIVKMMREYATSKTAFSLEPIYSISGDPTLRTTAIKFHVLSSNNK